MTVIVSDIILHAVLVLVRVRVIVHGVSVTVFMRMNNDSTCPFAFAANFGFDFTDPPALGAICFLFGQIFPGCHSNLLYMNSFLQFR